MEETVKVAENNALNEKKVESRRSGEFQGVIQEENRFMIHGAILVRDRLRTTVREAESTMRGAFLKGRGRNVAIVMVKLFRKDTIETFYGWLLT